MHLKCKEDKLKKFLLFIITVLGLSLFVSCGKTDKNNNKNNNAEEPKTYELIADNHFKQGFTVSPANKTTSPDTRWPLAYDFKYLDKTQQTVWQVGQHGCYYGLADHYWNNEKEIEYKDGYYIIEDESKAIKVNPDTGSLIMELNASKEYDHPRKDKEEWPHILFQESFTKQPLIKDLESLKLSMNVLMHKSEMHMTTEEYNPSLHTIQYIMYIYVYSNAALDAGQYMFFGIPIYDYRYKVMRENGLIDAGTAGNTGNFIYQMSTLDYLPNGLTVGQEEHIEIDLIQSISNALILAQTFGKLANSTINDLYITSMNIGFEIPGTFDCSIELSGLSLIASEKN